MAASRTPLFPVFLKLAGRCVLVVGGGAVAAAKVPALCAAGAEVTVVAPQVVPDLAALDVRIERRDFRPADLDGVWMAVAAAAPNVNRAVAAAAARRQVFVNAVDDPDNASAYLGGVVRRGGVTVAISTDGQAPALAGLLREELEAALPEADMAAWMREALRLRRRWQAENTPLAARRPALRAALRAGLSGPQRHGAPVCENSR